MGNFYSLVNQEPMMPNSTPQPSSASQGKQIAVWLVLLAAAGTFALTMGTRQTMGLFLSSLNTATGLGVGSISLAFAIGQLWWGLTQPFAIGVLAAGGAGMAGPAVRWLPPPA
jgi:hypothetical protein